MTTATNTERAKLMGLRRTADSLISSTRSPFCSAFEVAQAIEAVEAVLAFMAPVWGTNDSLYRSYAKTLADLKARVCAVCPPHGMTKSLIPNQLN